MALWQSLPSRAQEPFSNEFPSQYHIQTDQGPSRFFRFQTLSGQFRKERRHENGDVEGSYGWVDPNGVLRLFDYISDAGGYRIEKQRLFKVSIQIFGQLRCKPATTLCNQNIPCNQLMYRLEHKPRHLTESHPPGAI